MRLVEPTEQVTIQPDPDSLGENTQTLERPTSPLPGAGRQTTGNRGLKHIDRGLLWFLSTTGCRRAVVRQYFDDTDHSPFQDTESLHSQVDARPVLPNPCCDNCTNQLGISLSPEIQSLLVSPIDMEVNPITNLGRPIVEREPVGQPEVLNPVVRRNFVSRIQRSALKANIEKLRIEIWSQEGLNRPTVLYGPEMFLQDKSIASLIQKAGSIQDIESLTKALEHDDIDLQFSALAPYATKLLEIIQSTLTIQPDIPGPNTTINQGQETLTTPISGTTAPAIAGCIPSAIPPPSTLDFTPLPSMIPHRTPGKLSHSRGRPPAALRLEQSCLEAAIAQIAQDRLAEAIANGEDGSRWNLSLLGRRSRGRPTVEMQEARKRVEEAKAEIANGLITSDAYPLLWAKSTNRPQ